MKEKRVSFLYHIFIEFEVINLCLYKKKNSRQSHAILERENSYYSYYRLDDFSNFFNDEDFYRV